MYVGSETQVCANMPIPASGNHGPNGYSPYYYGSYGPPPVFHQPGPPNSKGQYPAPYFPQPSSYQYQQQGNFGPVDTRFTQHSKDQVSNVFQPPVALPMPPMNVPPPFMQYQGQIPFPPSMPYYTQYSMLPPNGMINNYPNPSSLYQAPPSRVSNGNNGKNFNGAKFHPCRPNDRKLRQEQSKFHCGSCDKDFYAKNKYDEHVAQHVSCCLDGCTFSAHPMIMEKHIAMQHRSGLFKRIVKGNSPEEIEKWVTERKKQYPTLDKISEKQLQKIEMEKRGERYNDRRQSSNNRNKNLKDRRNQQRFPNSNKSFGNNTRNFESRLNGVNPRRSRTPLDSVKAAQNQTPSDTEKAPQNRTPELSVVEKVPRKVEVDNFEFRRNLPAFRGTEYYLLPEAKDLQQERNYSDSDSEEYEASSSIIEEHQDLEELDTSFNSTGVTTAENKIHTICPLDLIRGYDSQDSSDEDYDEPSPSLTKESEQSPMNVDNDPGCSSKRLILDSPTKLELSSVNDNDSDSGPEECSSKLPVPDFILCDSPGLASDKKEAESIPSRPPTPEIVNDSNVDKGKSSLERFKKPTRKRIHHHRNRNEKTQKKKQAVKNEECCQQDQQDKKSQTVLPPPKKRCKRPTLLEKLLAPEIKRERNIILQCVRYVVNNNYFDIGSTSKTDTNNIHSG